MRLANLKLMLLPAGALAAPVAFAIEAAPQASPVASPNVARGGKLFLQCRACHTVAPGGAHTVGPNLAGVFGARAASRPGYRYSPSLAQSGVVWNAATLDAFLKRPSQAVPGNKMAFAGVADARSRSDLVGYLATLKGKP